MSPARSAVVVSVLVVVAVLVAPLGVASWIAALAGLLLVALTFLAGITLRQRG